MTIGRNDPCPCGSGKKYKKCCIDKGSDPVIYMKQKIDRFHERIVDELMRHGDKMFNSEALYEAADEFFGWPEEEEAEELDLEGHLTVFYPGTCLNGGSNRPTAKTHSPAPGTRVLFSRIFRPTAANSIPSNGNISRTSPMRRSAFLKSPL